MAENAGDQAEEQRRLVNRRDLLVAGLATAGGLAFGEGILSALAKPTPGSGKLGEYETYVSAAPTRARERAAVAPSSVGTSLNLTEENILGPFHRAGAPFRAKISPPLAPGTAVVVSGTVWSYKTKKPLPHTTIDVWHASEAGRYDNDDPAHPPRPGVFLYRARLITDENGCYEYETIHPGRYEIGKEIWRPSHIHYWVRHPEHKELVTQLFFDRDPHNAKDQFIKKSLIVVFLDEKIRGQTLERGKFDIVLAQK
ncbi:MAG: hypothetical protein K2Z81_17340 [Cyanobacteria bacterium]|nr:hypothetical protein [Cyanobacteriota bacterium]